MDKPEPPVELDWTEKVFPQHIDLPITTSLSPDTGEVVVESVSMHPGVKGGIRHRFHFSPAAARELMAAIRHFETELGMQPEALAKPGSVQ